MRLWAHYFRQGEAEASAGIEQAQERVAAIRSLVTSFGFRTELVDWIESEISQRRVRPGVHENMLYECGLMDGLELVRQRLRALEGMARDS